MRRLLAIALCLVATGVLAQTKYNYVVVPEGTDPNTMLTPATNGLAPVTYVDAATNTLNIALTNSIRQEINSVSNVYAFRAEATNDQVVTAGAYVYATVNFPEIQFDTHAAYATNTSIFSFPVTGLWYVASERSFTGVGTTDGLYYLLQHRESASITNTYYNTGANNAVGGGMASVSRLLNITTTGQWVRVRCTANDTSYTLTGSTPTKFTEGTRVLNYSCFQAFKL